MTVTGRMPTLGRDEDEFVVVPCAPASVHDDSPTVRMIGTKPNGKAPAVRLLVVDDSPAIREALLDGFMGTGIDVVGEAGNGVEGVERASALQPDVILLDMRMPVLDGLAAIPLLRRNARRSRIVAYTALPTEVSDDGGRGVDAVLSKSATFDRIVAVIHEVAARTCELD